MKLWVDDLRYPPDDQWTWVKTSDSAVALLRLTGTCEVMSLDHDLGEEDTPRPVVLWLCEHPERWPTEVRVHSSNPGGPRLAGEHMIERYKPGEASDGHAVRLPARDRPGQRPVRGLGRTQSPAPRAPRPR
jgi:hypothetical protein